MKTCPNSIEGQGLALNGETTEFETDHENENEQCL